MVGGRKCGDDPARRALTAAARGCGLALAVLAAACDDATTFENRPSFVFDWLRDGNRDIYRSSVDGLVLVRLNDHTSDDQNPSSTSSLVVFTSFRDGNGELYTIPLSGGAPRRITTTAAADESEPAISRDGARIAYISDVTGTPKLWMCSADGSNQQRLTATFGFEGSIEVSPAWSPAGDRIAFVATNGGTADIFLLVPGSSPSFLVGGANAEVEPAWSPDGTEVAFVSNRDGDDEIYVVNVGSGQVRRITNRPGIDAQPAWMPDGKLVYTAWVDNVPRLRWLDPAAPNVVNEIGTFRDAQHPAPVF